MNDNMWRAANEADSVAEASRLTMHPGKRILDLVVSAALAIPATTLVLLVCPIIWWETRANPLFLQQRVGRGGKAFVLAKLRTMHPDTSHGPSHEIGVSSVTRLGKLLRRTKIDEIPQIWNVLVGEMSLVGPRPCLPSQAAVIAARSERGVMALRPGITGPAQIGGWDMSDPEALSKADATYLAPWSLRRDLALLVSTVLGKGSGDAASRQN